MQPAEIRTNVDEEKQPPVVSSVQRIAVTGISWFQNVNVQVHTFSVAIFLNLIFWGQMSHSDLKTLHLTSVCVLQHLSSKWKPWWTCESFAAPSIHAHVGWIPSDPAWDRPSIETVRIGLCHMCTQRMSMNYTSGCEQLAVAVELRLSEGGICLKSAAFWETM